MQNETNETDLRQERGRLLSLDKRIKNVAGVTWVVPSQTSETAYLVNAKEGTCSCPDYELRRCRCKHQWAISFGFRGSRSRWSARGSQACHSMTW